MTRMLSRKEVLLLDDDCFDEHDSEDDFNVGKIDRITRHNEYEHHEDDRYCR